VDNQVLEDLKIQCDGPIKLFSDNESTINIAHNHVQHDRTKQPTFLLGIPLAYVLTKNLPTERLSQLTCNRGMIDIPFTSLRKNVVNLV